MPISEQMSNGRRGQSAALGGFHTTRLADAAQIAGVAVVRGATSNVHCKVPASEAECEKMLGVAQYMPSLPMVDGTNEYAQDDEVTIKRSGEIFVVTEEAVAPTDDVYVRHTANGANTQLGAFRNDPDDVDTVLSLTETDANVEDGVFTVVIEDNDGVQYQASFESSSSSHAAAAAGIAAAIDAVAPTNSTPGAEVADVIDIAIAMPAGRSIKILHVESVGASALAADSGGATCARVKNASFDETTTGSGTARLILNMPQ